MSDTIKPVALAYVVGENTSEVFFSPEITITNAQSMVIVPFVDALRQARDDALEAAAKVCEQKREGADTVRVSPSAYDKAAYGWDECAIVCAAAIRALIEKKGDSDEQD